MKVEVDFSGLDEFLEDAENEIKQGYNRSSPCRRGLLKRKRGTTKTIPQPACAPGSAVVINGEIVDMYARQNPDVVDAKSKTENLSIYGKRPQNGIIIADGMEYASYVEGKGREVISSGRFTYVSEIGKKFSK